MDDTTAGFTAPPVPGWMRWLEKYLDPATMLGEILFGLIMTLTFTLAAGVAMQEEGREGARAMLIAILGCNVAWGIIDGALYLTSQMFERGERRSFGRLLRSGNETASLQLMADRFDEMFGDAVGAEERTAMYRRILARVNAQAPRHAGITGSDWMAALFVCIAVIVSTFPAALPFAFIEDPWLALRVSNAILLVLLFFCGWAWARYTPSKPWKVGLGFLAGGVALVLLAIPLGG